MPYRSQSSAKDTQYIKKTIAMESDCTKDGKAWLYMSLTWIRELSLVVGREDQTQKRCWGWDLLDGSRQSGKKGRWCCKAGKDIPGREKSMCETSPSQRIQAHTWAHFKMNVFRHSWKTGFPVTLPPCLLPTPFTFLSLLQWDLELTGYSEHRLWVFRYYPPTIPAFASHRQVSWNCEFCLNSS